MHQAVGRRREVAPPRSQTDTYLGCHPAPSVDISPHVIVLFEGARGKQLAGCRVEVQV